MKHYAQVENKVAYKLGLISSEMAADPAHIGGKEYTDKIFSIDRESYENGINGNGVSNKGKKIKIKGMLVPAEYVIVF